MKSILWLRLLSVACLFTLQTSIAFAQSDCKFYEDFTSSNGWTQVGSNVTINNGTVEYQNGAADAEQRRVYKPIGTSLSATTAWKAEFEFTPKIVGDYGGPHAGHALLSLTAGTQEPFSDCPDVPCTGYPLPTQDGISCVYGGPSNPSDGNVYLYIIATDGSTSLTPYSALIPANTMGITYYIRMERLSAGQVELSVFSDAGRTVHMPGSPVNLSIPAYIGGLNTIQHGNIARGGWYRELTGTVDNVCLNWERPCDYYEDFSSSTGWTQVGSNVTINNGTVEYQNGAADAEQRRVYKPIGNTLTATTTWKAEFEFTPESVGDYGGPHAGHALLSLTAGNQEPFNNCPDIPCSGYPAPVQDGIACSYGGPSNPSDGNVYLYINLADGTTGQTPYSTLIPASTMGITYYIRLERLSASIVELSVFSDAGRTIHVPGSPVSMSIPSYIGGLNTIQHGNIARGGWYRQLTGTVDNVCLNWERPCDYYEDFTSSNGWTQVGSNVTINNGTVEYQNGAADAEQRRVYKPIGNTLTATTTWKAEFEFTPESVGDYGGPHAGHALLSLTAGTQEPFSDCPDVPCSGYPLPTQHGISCTYGGPSNPSDGNVYLYITATDGSTSFTPYSALIPANTMGVTYFIRLERLSAGLVELSVFSDAGRTIHLPGSPVSLSIPTYIGGFNTIQHGNIARGGWYRELTGTVDNVCLNITATSATNQAALAPDLVKVCPNPTNADITVSSEMECLKSVQVLDITGRVMRNVELDGFSTTYTIPLADLKAGTYILTGSDCTGQVFSKRVVKL